MRVPADRPILPAGHSAQGLPMIVLAGGFGTRLQSVLPATPKALAPVGDIPFLALQLQNWIAQGVRVFLFMLHHHADQIIDFVEGSRDGLLRGCEATCLVEPTPMDTGGAIAFAVRERNLQGDFLVANADTWLGGGIGELTQAASPAMAVIRVDDTGRYGQVEFDDHRRVTVFREKDARGLPGWINAGMCRLNAELFRDWDGQRFSLERKTFLELAARERLTAVELDSDFIDIGIPKDYSQFCRWVEEGRIGSLCS
jgi:NDP-sugar pyrophosphorylase family protein